MINFYPGPSKIYPRVKDYVADGLQSGILSMNHRSPQFMKLMGGTVKILKEKLKIPTGYQIVFTSSATECWEIIAQSLIVKKSSHIFNGTFGEKWMSYTKKLISDVQLLPYGLNEFPQTHIDDDSEVICFTQNETSNGTQVPQKVISETKSKCPDQIIVVDATSSMAGIELDFDSADIWFASVQKCFGLPAGMAILICSPNAVRQVNIINESAHYNSFNCLLENARKNQTAYTPNILDIYLLYRLMDEIEGITLTSKKVIARFDEIVTLINHSSALSLLVENDETISNTVITVEPVRYTVNEVKVLAKHENIILGSGYGTWKETTFRIANFPAISEDEWKALMLFLSKIN